METDLQYFLRIKKKKKELKTGNTIYDDRATMVRLLSKKIKPTVVHEVDLKTNVHRLRGMGKSLEEISDELNIPLWQVKNVFQGCKRAKRTENEETKAKRAESIRKYWDDPESHRKVRHQPPKVNKYKGVHKLCGGAMYQARILWDGKYKYLGDFKTEIEAARAYNDGVDFYYGGDGFKNEV